MIFEINFNFFMIIFSAIIVENAVFLESFINELLLPLMDIIKLFFHKKTE